MLLCGALYKLEGAVYRTNKFVNKIKSMNARAKVLQMEGLRFPQLSADLWYVWREMSENLGYPVNSLADGWHTDNEPRKGKPRNGSRPKPEPKAAR